MYTLVGYKGNQWVRQRSHDRLVQLQWRSKQGCVPRQAHMIATHVLLGGIGHLDEGGQNLKTESLYQW